MRSDQIAEIAPFIREMFEAALNPTSGSKELCATFEVVGVSGAWAQVTRRQLNIAYPPEASPELELGEILSLLPTATLIEWEPNKFATWSFFSDNPREIAKVVDAMLTTLFQLGDYSVDVQLEDIS